MKPTPATDMHMHTCGQYQQEQAADCWHLCLDLHNFYMSGSNVHSAPGRSMGGPSWQLYHWAD